MARYSNIELEIINISLGLTIKFHRLNSGYSQLDLGIKSDTDNTIVGRIERAEHISSWENIYKVSQELGLNYCSLFIFQPKKELLNLVDSCISLDTKLTKAKRKYYDDLKDRIQKLFVQVSET